MRSKIKINFKAIFFISLLIFLSSFLFVKDYPTLLKIFLFHLGIMFFMGWWLYIIMIINNIMDKDKIIKKKVFKIIFFTILKFILLIIFFFFSVKILKTMVMISLISYILHIFLMLLFVRPIRV